jgi:hypothetical protein
VIAYLGNSVGMATVPTSDHVTHLENMAAMLALRSRGVAGMVAGARAARALSTAAETPVAGTYAHVLPSRRGAVGIVRLNRPKALNGTYTRAELQRQGDTCACVPMPMPMCVPVAFVCLFVCLFVRACLHPCLCLRPCTRVPDPSVRAQRSIAT